MNSEIFSAIITVAGSVVTFFLASLFSHLSRQADESNGIRRELLNRRLAYYDDLLRWLPVEKLVGKNGETGKSDVSVGFFVEVATHHFLDFPEFIARGRLYGSDKVVGELIVFQKVYNTLLSKTLANQESRKVSVNGEYRGADAFEELIVAHRSFAARIIALVGEEVTVNSLRKSFGKPQKKRHEKHDRTDREHN